jgi:aspartate aminotransferase-like enzyme
MRSTSALTFKIATEKWHFAAIHRLNYKTFVEEIPQHERNPAKRLIDRFHRDNAYIVALRGRKLLGMAAVRDQRPFSLDAKIQNMDAYLPPGRSVCEIRLLALEPEARLGRLFYGLMRKLYDYCLDRGYDLAVISGTVRQLKLYKHLGFAPFGPLVGNDVAKFQPMYLTREAIQLRLRRTIRPRRDSMVAAPAANFLPGPVTVRDEVRRRFAEPPVSHRSESFVADFKSTRKLLCDLVNGNHVEILTGSGTLANDAIAAQLSLSPEAGLVLSSGEFGERLIDHATRFELSFEVLRAVRGQSFSRDQIQRAVDLNPELRWLWAVHCETSTGALNDLEMLKEVCAENRLRLHMDCISSIGAVPVDLSGVALASGVSGKALGAFPGLSLVFHHRAVAPAPYALPRYLDIGYYAVNDGIPFTLSSNLLYALRAALVRFDKNDFARIADLAAWLRAEIRHMGLSVVGDEKFLSPAVTTIALPEGVTSKKLGKELENAGHLVSYMSGYLLERNWLQICLMGHVSAPKLQSMVEALQRLTSKPSRHEATSPPLLAKAS